MPEVFVATQPFKGFARGDVVPADEVDASSPVVKTNHDDPEPVLGQPEPEPEPASKEG